METLFDLIDKHDIPQESRQHLDYSVYRIRPADERIMFLMQNPGGDEPGKREVAKHRELGKRTALAEQREEWVQANARSLLEWFNGRNPDQPKKFGKGFQDVVGEVFRDLKALKPDDFWSQFYVTDFVKGRKRTKELTDADFEVWAPVLREEIRRLRNLRLILIFGTRTWDAFRLLIDQQVSLVGGSSYVPPSRSVTDVHGLLFKMSEGNKFVIPLVHMSHQPFQNALRNTYFDFLKEGLVAFQQHAGG